MAQQREVRQSYLRNLLQEQDQMHLVQNGYNHNQHFQMEQVNQNNNVIQSYPHSEEQYTAMNARNQQQFTQNSMECKQGGDKAKTSNEKIDTIPKEVYDTFKKLSNLKKQSVKAILKKWNTQCKEDEDSKKCVVRQYHKKQEVERRALRFSNIQTSFYSQNKCKGQPRDQDLALFICSLNCFDPSRSTLRLCFDQRKGDQALNLPQQNDALPLEEQLFQVTLRNSIYQDLKELSIQVEQDQFYTISFFQTCVSSLDFYNLSYLQISFLNKSETKITLSGQHLQNLSYQIRRYCSQLRYLILEFKEVDLVDQDFEQISNNIIELKELIYIDFCLINTPNITTQNIVNLIKGLTLFTKTQIELKFPEAQNIEMNDDLYEVITTILDLPQMYFLKSLQLEMPVIFPAEKQLYCKQIINIINEQIFKNKIPYLNDLKIFVNLHQNTERLIGLKSFNFQKIWVQLIKLKKAGLLNKCRKEIAWELSEFQELFIF